VQFWEAQEEHNRLREDMWKSIEFPRLFSREGERTPRFTIEARTCDSWEDQEMQLSAHGAFYSNRIALIVLGLHVIKKPLKLADQECRSREGN
jgi:hypothetical protein